MRFRRAGHFLLLTFGAMLLSGCGGAISTLPTGQYEAKLIGPVPAGTFIAHVFAINRKGEVAGAVQTSGGNTRTPFTWSQTGGFKLLSVPSGLKSADAWALNDLGTVVGSGIDGASASHALVWDKDGNVQEISSIGRPYSALQAINNNGQAVGLYVTLAGAIHPMSWNAQTGVTDISAQLGATATAYDINDSGTIVGTTQSNGIQQAFVYTPSGGLNILSEISGIASSAEKVTNNNIVSGFVLLTSTTSASFFWSASGGGRVLSGAPQISKRASVMNSSGIMVGGGLDAYQWTKAGGFKLLTQLTQGLPSGVTLHNGFAINDSDEIAARATDQNYYLLVPKR